MTEQTSRAVHSRAALSRALKTINEHLEKLHGPAFQLGDVSTTGDCLLSPKEASSAIGLSEKTLANWRCSGTAPLPFVRTGSRIRYRTSDVLTFLDANHRNSTSDNGGHDDHR